MYERVGDTYALSNWIVEARLKAVGEPEGKRNDSQCGICVSAGRKNRAAGNVQIIDTMDLALGIYYAIVWIFGHASRTHVVFASD